MNVLQSVNQLAAQWQSANLRWNKILGTNDNKITQDFLIQHVSIHLLLYSRFTHPSAEMANSCTLYTSLHNWIVFCAGLFLLMVNEACGTHCLVRQSCDIGRV